jgi:hypothetical protein
LSGGALAASNGQDTTSQNAHNVWLEQGSSNAQTQVSGQSSDASQQSQYASSQSTNSTGDSGRVSINESENGGSTANTANETAIQQGSGGTSTNGAQSSESGSPKASSTSKSTSPSQATTSSTQTTGRGQISGSMKSLNDNVTPSIISQTTASSTNVVPEVAVVAPVAQPADSDSKTEVRTTILPIQPVITNRATALTPDLAESMPSAPAPSRAPVPAKSTGVLAGLVVGLSNVVIPQPVFPTAAVNLKLMLGISLLTLVVLLANVFEFSYGQWLRRGGFATAARSDEPTDNISSPLFATPLLSGYVEQPPRLHNPVSLVLVPNAYRKEDRR